MSVVALNFIFSGQLALAKTAVPLKTKKSIIKPGMVVLKASPVKTPLTPAGIIKWTNTDRLANHPTSTVLKENVQLNNISAQRAADMFKRQYFDHNTPTGETPADIAKQSGYNYLIVGENIALGHYYDDEALVNAWMSSPHHRENILNDRFSEIGVAVAEGTFNGEYTWIAVQTFGRPLADCPTPSSDLKTIIQKNNSELINLSTQAKNIYESVIRTTPHNNEEVIEYNNKVILYNSLITQTRTLSESNALLVEQYNQSARNFNTCINN